MKKRAAATFAKLAATFIIIITVGVCGFGIYSAADLNSEIGELTDIKIDEDAFDEIAKFESYLETEPAFVRAFMLRKGALNKYMKKANEYADNRASEIEAAIAEITPSYEITSYEDYIAKRNRIYDLELTEHSEYHKAVRQYVDNYDVLEQHMADFENLLKKYETKCRTC